MKLRAQLPALALTATLATVLAGCSATPAAETDDSVLTIVTSTNVYADIAKTIAGDDVTVEAIITSGAQDPHEYEATARDRLKASKADLVIDNGGGYDSFMGELVSDGTARITVSDLAADAHDAEEHDHDHDHADEDHEHAEDDGHGHIAGFNEHVWYDPDIMSTLALHIAEELTTLDSSGAAGYTERATDFQNAMADLDDKLATLGHDHEGAGFFATEPVATRLLEHAGLHDETPAAFSEAVEEGQDVPPATLLEALGILASGAVSVVVVNTQSGGAEADRIESEADKAGLPLVKVSELLPEDTDYVTWMTQNLDALTQALS